MNRYALVFGEPFKSESAVAAIEQVVDKELLDEIVAEPDRNYVFHVGIGDQALVTTFKEAAKSLASSSRVMSLDAVAPEKGLAIECITEAVQIYDGCITDYMGETPYIIVSAPGKAIAAIGILNEIGVRKVGRPMPRSALRTFNF